MLAYAKAAIEVLQKLNINKVVPVGWSLGGDICVEVIPLFQGMKGLVIIGALLIPLLDALDDDCTRWIMRQDPSKEESTMSAKSGTGGP